MKTWSKTQGNVAKSSAESELQGIVKGSCEGLGACTLMEDLGTSCKIRVHVDANAAKGIVERQGIQKVRHLEVDRLWLQEQEARRMLPFAEGRRRMQSRRYHDKARERGAYDETHPRVEHGVH